MNPTGAQIAAVSDTRTVTAQTHGCTEWDKGGIRAALIQTDGPVGTVMAAAHLAAEDPSLDYPSARALAYHWPKNGRGNRPAPRWTPCGEHPDQDAATCPMHAGDMTPEQIAEAAAEARAVAAEARAAARERQAVIDTKRQEATR